jgi:hypothetical protein
MSDNANMILSQGPKLVHYYKVNASVKLNVSVKDKITGNTIKVLYSKGGGSFTETPTYTQALNTTVFYKIVSAANNVELKLSWVDTNPSTAKVNVGSNDVLTELDPTAGKKISNGLLFTIIFIVLAIIGYLFYARKFRRNPLDQMMVNPPLGS